MKERKKILFFIISIFYKYNLIYKQYDYKNKT